MCEDEQGWFDAMVVRQGQEPVAFIERFATPETLANMAKFADAAHLIKRTNTGYRKLPKTPKRMPQTPAARTVPAPPVCYVYALWKREASLFILVSIFFLLGIAHLFGWGLSTIP